MKKAVLYFFFVFGVLQNTTAQNVPAEFPGGDSAWQTYLDTAIKKQNLINQSTTKDIERFGRTQTVHYGFGIMTDGTISLITIEGQASQAVRTELNRILKNCPRWKPATVNGKPVVYRKKQVTVFNFD